MLEKTIVFEVLKERIFFGEHERDSPFNIASGTELLRVAQFLKANWKAARQGEEWIHPSKESTSAATTEEREFRAFDLRTAGFPSASESLPLKLYPPCTAHHLLCGRNGLF